MSRAEAAPLSNITEEPAPVPLSVAGAKKNYGFLIRIPRFPQKTETLVADTDYRRAGRSCDNHLGFFAEFAGRAVYLYNFLIHAA